MLYFWVVEGVPVAFAGFNRPTADGVSIGPVYTPPEYRGKGYASALVASMTAMALSSPENSVPLSDAAKAAVADCHYTQRDWVALITEANHSTAERIYRSIGFVPVRDLFDITLREEITEH